jgi:hypothetical protein
MSFPRKREPMTTALARELTPVVMGPRLRGDDEPINPNNGFPPP